MKVEATARKVRKEEMGKMKVATRSLYWAGRCAAAGQKEGGALLLLLLLATAAARAMVDQSATSRYNSSSARPRPFSWSDPQRAEGEEGGG